MYDLNLALGRVQDLQSELERKINRPKIEGQMQFHARPRIRRTRAAGKQWKVYEAGWNLGGRDTLPWDILRSDAHVQHEQQPGQKAHNQRTLLLRLGGIETRCWTVQSYQRFARSNPAKRSELATDNTRAHFDGWVSPEETINLIGRLLIWEYT